MKKLLPPNQRHTAYLELSSVRFHIFTGKRRPRRLPTYQEAQRQCSKRAFEACMAGFVDAAVDLCVIANYFDARANPGCYCGGFRFERKN